MSKTFTKTTAGERLYGSTPLCPYRLPVYFRELFISCFRVTAFVYLIDKMVDRRKVNSADEVPKESDRQFLGNK